MATSTTEQLVGHALAARPLLARRALLLGLRRRRAAVDADADLAAAELDLVHLLDGVPSGRGVRRGSPAPCRWPPAPPVAR